MPEIVQYNNQDTQLRPTEVGTEALAQEGRRVGAFYHQIGADVGSAVKSVGDQYQDYVTHQEVSRQMASYSQGMNDLNQKWSDTVKNADPNDPTVAAKFRAQYVEPFIDQWSQGFSTKVGQNFATERTQALRQHFFEKTAADQSHLAGEAGVVNTQTTVNALGNSAANDPSPSNIDLQLGTLDATIDGFVQTSKTLSPEDAARLKGELTLQGKAHIVDQGIRSLTFSDPQRALDLLNSGKYDQYLGTQRGTLTAEAIQQQRYAAEQARQAQTLAQKQHDDQGIAQISAATATLFGPDGSYRPNPDALAVARRVALTPGYSPPVYEQARAALEMSRTALDATIEHRDVQSDPSVYSQFASRLTIPPGQKGSLSKAEIMTAVTTANMGGRGLSMVDGREMLEGLDHVANDPAARQGQESLTKYLTNVKGAITKSTLVSNDTIGDIKYAQFVTDANIQYRRLVASGKSPQEAADLLTNPRNPGSLNSQIPSYQVTSKQGLAGLKEEFATKDNPRGATNVPAPVANPQLGDKAPAIADPDAWLAAHRKR